jgi:hypothetical protein
MRTTKTFAEAVDLAKDIDNIDAENKEDLIAVMIYKLTETYGDANTLVLEKLTGLDLNTQEKLYDYFSKTLDLESKDIGELAFCMLKDLSKF